MKRYPLVTGIVALSTAALLTAGCSSGQSSGGSGQSSSNSPSSSASSSPSSSANSAAEQQRSIDQLLKDNPIKFELNKAELNDESKQTVKKVAEALAKAKDSKIKVTGFVYKNSLPPEEEKSLSDKRAKAVGEELQQNKIDQSRITTEAGGPAEGGASAKIEVTG